MGNPIQALEAEAAYKASVAEANEFHAHMQKVKSAILQSVRELILQSDYILKTVTVTYFQLQQTLCTPLPTQVCPNMEYDFYSKGEKYPEPLQTEKIVWNIGRFSVLFCFVAFNNLITYLLHGAESFLRS